MRMVPMAILRRSSAASDVSMRVDLFIPAVLVGPRAVYLAPRPSVVEDGYDDVYGGGGEGDGDRDRDRDGGDGGGGGDRGGGGGLCVAR